LRRLLRWNTAHLSRIRGVLADADAIPHLSSTFTAPRLARSVVIASHRPVPILLSSAISPFKVLAIHRLNRLVPVPVPPGFAPACKASLSPPSLSYLISRSHFLHYISTILVYYDNVKGFGFLWNSFSIILASLHLCLGLVLIGFGSGTGNRRFSPHVCSLSKSTPIASYRACLRSTSSSFPLSSLSLEPSLTNSRTRQMRHSTRGKIWVRFDCCGVEVKKFCCGVGTFR